MKKHKILDKNIVLGSILMLIISAIPMTLLPFFGAANDTLTAFLSILGAIVALLLFDRIFKGEFQGFIKGGDNKTGIKLATIMIFYYLFLICQMLICGKYASPTLLTFVTACAAGCTEETMFRGYLVSYLLRHKNNSKAIPWILVISMAVFGLVHMANIAGGAPLGITIMQTIGAAGMGALFGAVYLRSGNILIPMVIHGLTDFIAFLDRAQTTEGGLMIAKVSFTNYVDVFICILLCAAGFYLIRPEKRDEIISMWNNKWIREQE